MRARLRVEVWAMVVVITLSVVACAARSEADRTTSEGASETRVVASASAKVATPEATNATEPTAEPTTTEAESGAAAVDAGQATRTPETAVITVATYTPGATAGNPTKATTPAPTAQPPEVGMSAPELTLMGLDGTPHALSDYRGKVVMLNFWASWCGHCRSEIPALESVYEEYRDRGFEIVAVSVGEDPAELKAFVEENGMTFVVLADTQGAAMAPYQLQSVPTSYFLDAEGVIRQVYHGAIPEDILRGIVQELLEG